MHVPAAVHASSCEASIHERAPQVMVLPPDLRGCGDLVDLSGPVSCSSRFWPGPARVSANASCLSLLAGGVGRRRGLLVVSDGRQVVLRRSFSAPVTPQPGLQPPHPPPRGPGTGSGGSARHPRPARCIFWEHADAATCALTCAPLRLPSPSHPLVYAVILTPNSDLTPSGPSSSWDSRPRPPPSWAPSGCPWLESIGSGPPPPTYGTLGSGGGSYQEATPLPLSLGHFLLPPPPPVAAVVQTDRHTRPVC